jgi:hypothetical protein
MSCLLFLEDEESTGKINIDELYEKNKKRDLKHISIFNKILNRIHKRITTTSRNKYNDKHIWFTVPEYIFGEPLYDQSDCIAYVVSKLEENGFFINYIHPNTLFISWSNWVPTYVRNEWKKKRGVIINEKGEIVEDRQQQQQQQQQQQPATQSDGGVTTKNGKQYTSIDKYKPNGNFIYNADVIEKLEKKVINF